LVAILLVVALIIALFVILVKFVMPITITRDGLNYTLEALGRGTTVCLSFDF